MEDSRQDDALVAAFQALSGNAPRRRALEGLVKALTHQQIRELQSAMEEVDLHCDVIAELPIEISQIILQHLPLYQIFQAQRVSKKWRRILSSAHIVEHALQDWYPKRDVDPGLQIPADLSAESVASLKAEHIDAYRTGHAFTYARYQYLPADPDFDLMAYADGIMAWVDTTDSHSVRLLDLKTRQKWSFWPENRTIIRAIAVSSSMVAGLGSGRCNVWTLPTGDCHTLRLPSAYPNSVAVSAGTLAIMQGYNSQGADTRAEIVTWTLKDQKALSFSVALGPREKNLARRWKVMLDNNGDYLHLFEWARNRDPGCPTHFYHIRTSLDGGVLTQCVVEAPDTKDYYDCSCNTVPKETNRQAVIWSFAKRQRRTDDSSELMLICYNFQEDRLQVRMPVVRDFRMNGRTSSNLFHWKDTAYFLQHVNDRRGLTVIDFLESSCSEAVMDFYVNPEWFDSQLQVHEELLIFLFGDESFLIMVYGEGFGVWCFDANVQMYDEDVTYKELRKSNRERRLLSKQNGKEYQS